MVLRDEGMMQMLSTSEMVALRVMEVAYYDSHRGEMRLYEGRTWRDVDNVLGFPPMFAEQQRIRIALQ